jgi:hypothetical protein
MSRFHVTHTFAELEVSRETYEEIEGKLREAGYDHAFGHDRGAIDMHGIGLVREEPLQEAGVCQMPPPGWVCSRPSGHEGPCAARPKPLTNEPSEILALNSSIDGWSQGYRAGVEAAANLVFPPTPPGEEEDSFGRLIAETILRLRPEAESEPTQGEVRALLAGGPSRLENAVPHLREILADARDGKTVGLLLYWKTVREDGRASFFNSVFGDVLESDLAYMSVILAALAVARPEPA